MGETDLHRQDMVDVIDTLADRFAAEADVYVTGNLLLFYEEGNRRKHISPDVFVVRGVPKLPPRDYYLLWKEGRSPDVVIEITSKTTRREDQKKKLAALSRHPEGARVLPVRPDGGLPEAAAAGVPAGRAASTCRSSRWRAGCRARCWACTWSATAASCGSTTRRPAVGC